MYDKNTDIDLCFLKKPEQYHGSERRGVDVIGGSHLLRYRCLETFPWTSSANKLAGI
jgi:hypothetical protein